MTVTATTRRSPVYTGNGTTTAFPFVFKVFANTNIQVLVTSAAGVISTAVLGSDYTVALNADQTVAPGGTVNYLTAPAAGVSLVILGALPYDQTLSLPGGGNFNPAAIENAFDRTEIQIQQLAEAGTRVLTLPAPAVAGTSLELPMPSASKVIGWNAAANALVNIDPVTFAGLVAYGTARADTFTGDSVTTGFTLSANPTALANIRVAVDGLVLTPTTDYTWASGTTLTFTVAPATGAEILVQYMLALPQGVSDLTASIGQLDASRVNFLQNGTGAVTRTGQSKLHEWPSVADFGAVGDGSTLDTAAFTNAQAAAAFVRVPAGFNCKVAAGLNYWQFFGEGTVFEPGIQWDLTRTPQTTAAAQKIYRTRTFGNYEQAVALSVTANSTDAQTRANTQVLGTTTQGMAQTYPDRDHVTAYMSGKSFAPDVTDSTTTYTATTLTNATVSTLNAAGSLKPGMIIDTLHATPLTGRIQSVSGNVITVDAWYTRTTGVAATPANGTGAQINPNTKIWVQNSVLSLAGTAANKQAQTGTGYELDIACDPSVGTNVWGFDAVTTGGKPEAHFMSRGSRTYGYIAKTGADYAYRSDTNTRGFSSKDDTQPFEAVQGGATVWSCDSDGGTTSKGVKRIGVLAAQCTNAAFVNVGPLPAAYGGLFWISGFNTSGGAEACFLLMVRSGTVVTISASDGSGLAITFQASGRQLQIKCGNAGTFQYTGHGFAA